MNGSLPILDLALVGQILLWISVILVFWMSGQASIYHPLSVYLAFHGLAFVIRPMLVCWLNFDHEWVYMEFEPTAEQMLRTLTASSLALLVFATVTILCGWSPTEFRSKVVQPFEPVQRRALLILTLLLVPLIAYSMHGMFSGAFWVEDRGGTYVIAGGSGYGLEAQYLAGPLVCAWLAVFRFSWISVLMVAPYVLLRGYAGSSRWSIILILLALGLVYAWQKRLKWPPLWAILLVLPAFMLFRAIGENRQYVQQLLHGEEFRRPVEHPGAKLIEKWRTKYDSPDFANFDYLTFVMAVVPERTGTFTYGSQYLQLFTEPIPRALWPGKPIGSPVRSFSLHNYGHFFGLTVSIIGDGWMSGGWVGIVVTLTVVGAVLGFLHSWFWRNNTNNMVALFYLIGLAMIPQWYRDGGISIAKFVFWNLSPLFIWIGLTWQLNGGFVTVSSRLIPRFSALRCVFPNPRPTTTSIAREDQT